MSPADSEPTATPHGSAPPGAAEPEVEDDKTAPVEERVTDADELWLRQVPPAGLDGDEVTARGFRLTDADGGKLSGARSSKQTAKGAYEERLAAKPGSTAGTWTLTVGSINAHGVECIDDSALAGVGPVGHTYIDFRDCSEAEYRGIRLDLIERLNARGRAYP